MKPWERVLEYWFGADDDGWRGRSDIWFKQSDDLDDEIHDRFGDDLVRATRGELDDWAATARGRLALILLIDQFARNIHRDRAEAYAHDPRAQALTVAGIERGVDRRLSVVERLFFYMPLMHAEDVELQDRSVRCFTQLVDDADDAHKPLCAGFLDHAVRHRDVVARFGRFPHRNALLGRESTEAEVQHLAGGKRF